MTRPSADQAERFIADGLILERAVVPTELIEGARALILDWLGTDSFNPSLVAQYNNRTFAPELGSDPRILCLAECPEVKAIIAAIVPDALPIQRAQIAIRLPRTYDHQQQPKALHVDGVNCPHLEEGQLNTFSLLVGVLVTDVVDPRQGALRVVRGGHWRMAEWFASGEYQHSLEQVAPDLEEYLQDAVTGSAGDVVFSHHLLPHAVGHNSSDAPRIVVYFRVSSAALPGDRVAHLKNPWRSMAGLKEIS